MANHLHQKVVKVDEAFIECFVYTRMGFHHFHFLTFLIEEAEKKCISSLVNYIMTIGVPSFAGNQVEILIKLEFWLFNSAQNLGRRSLIFTMFLDPCNGFCDVVKFQGRVIDLFERS